MSVERGAVLVRLPTDLAEWLTSRAGRLGTSRNTLVVNLLNDARNRSAIPGHKVGCTCLRCT